MWITSDRPDDGIAALSSQTAPATSSTAGGDLNNKPFQGVGIQTCRRCQTIHHETLACSAILRLTSLAEQAKVALEKSDFAGVVRIVDDCALQGLPPDVVPASIYNNRAAAYYNLGELDKAMEDVSRAVELDPNFATHYMTRAHVYFGLKEYEKGLQDADRAVELDPEDAMHHAIRGQALTELNRYEEARKAVDRAVELDPDMHESIRQKYLLRIEAHEFNVKLHEGVRAKKATAILPWLDWFHALPRGAQKGLLSNCSDSRTTYMTVLALMKRHPLVPPVLVTACDMIAAFGSECRDNLVPAGAIQVIIQALDAGADSRSRFEKGHRWRNDMREVGRAQVMTKGLAALQTLINPYDSDCYEEVLRAAGCCLNAMLEAQKQHVFVCLPGLLQAARVIWMLCLTPECNAAALNDPDWPLNIREGPLHSTSDKRLCFVCTSRALYATLTGHGLKWALSQWPAAIDSEWEKAFVQWERLKGFLVAKNKLLQEREEAERAKELAEAELKSNEMAMALLAEEEEEQASKASASAASRKKKKKKKKGQQEPSTGCAEQGAAEATVSSHDDVQVPLGDLQPFEEQAEAAFPLPSPPSPEVPLVEPPPVDISSPHVDDSFPPPTPSQVQVSLAEANFDTGRAEVPESTIGGDTTCIVCFENPKTHLAVPCGHQCACAQCSTKMKQCPYCRAPATLWVQARLV